MRVSGASPACTVTPDRASVASAAAVSLSAHCVHASQYAARVFAGFRSMASVSASRALFG